MLSHRSLCPIVHCVPAAFHEPLELGLQPSFPLGGKDLVPRLPLFLSHEDHGGKEGSAERERHSQSSWGMGLFCVWLKLLLLLGST